MKRLNDKTGQPFKRGDTREDGMIFEAYRKTKIDSDGYFYEAWHSQESFNKKINSVTKFRNKNESTKLGHLNCFVRSAKKRAEEKNLSFNLDKEFVASIATDKCPIFNTPFDWGLDGKGHTPFRPSLDRIIPELGYVKGNVVFISHLANTIKSNATEKELYAVADWLHDKRKEVLNALKDKHTQLPGAGDTAVKDNAAPGPVHGARPGKDRNSSDYYQGELVWADPNNCA
jgi:hypothetical protein